MAADIASAALTIEIKILYRISDCGPTSDFELARETVASEICRALEPTTTLSGLGKNALSHAFSLLPA